MKIVHVETVLSCGSYAKSRHWKQTRSSIHAAVRKCDWPPGSGKFTINRAISPLQCWLCRQIAIPQIQNNPIWVIGQVFLSDFKPDES